MDRLTFFLIHLIGGSTVLAQPANDNCAQAERLCPGSVLNGTTVGATSNASTDDDFCYSPSSTVWYKFTTNASGGNVTVHFTNLVFDPDPAKGQALQAIFYSAAAVCDETSYLPYSPCGDSGLAFDITSGVVCAANTTYWVQVNGTMLGAGVTEHADATFDISVSGPGIDVIFPTADISTSDNSFCQGEDIPVTTAISDCSDTTLYEWFYNGALVLSTTEDTFSTAILSDTGELYLIVTCDAICGISDTSDTLFLNVTPVSANAGPDKYIEPGDQVVLTGSGSGTPLWTPATALSSSTSFTPLAYPDQNATYFLTVTNGPCVATDEVDIYVGSLVLIYSGFTPNGDGINDTWVIGNSDSYPNMEVNVFDRSGQKVFSATNYSSAGKWWDGTRNGDQLPASAYYYVVDLKDPDIDDDIFKGVVTIIR